MDPMHRKAGPSYSQQHEILTNLTSRLYLLTDVLSILTLVTDSVHQMLDYEDCVIYLRDDERLTQWVAAGPKKGSNGSIMNPLTLSTNEGIVGAAARNNESQLVMRTALDSRYRKDDEHRGSELAVPILSNGKCIAVIDSEHRGEGFYTERDAEMLEYIAAIVALPLNQALHGYHESSHQEVDIAHACNALDTLTLTDEMTGILNRRAFSRHLKKAENELQDLCCAVFDLDGFKTINDSFGHHTGDDAIVTFAEILRKNLPQASTSRLIARLGGDEFGVLSPIQEGDDFRSCVDAIIHEYAGRKLAVKNQRIGLSASAGIAFGYAGNIWPRADEALYRAKYGGKNQVGTSHNAWIVSAPQRVAS